MKYLLIAILAATTSCTTTLSIERSPSDRDEPALVLRVSKNEQMIQGMARYLQDQARLQQGMSHE